MTSNADSDRDRRRRELMRAIQGEAATVLADLDSYISDLVRAQSACERILSSVPARLDHETMQFLYEYAIVCYARCFASGVRTKIGLDLKALMSEDALAFHEFVLGIRDKLLAHAVSALETVIPIRILKDPEVGEMGIEDVGTLHMRATWVLNRDVPKLLSIANGLRVILEAQREQVREAILEELEQRDVEAIYREPKITFSGMKSADFATIRRPDAGRHSADKPWPMA